MDSSTEISTKQWQVRVLNGPTQGASRLLTGRLSIGRAASADLHLGARDISRQHAQIIEDEQGRHILVDLASSNGTFVEGRGIDRHVLEPNTFFTIADIDVAYEEARNPPGPATEAPTVDARTLRGTAQIRRCETRDYPSATIPPAPPVEPDAEPAAPRVSTDIEGNPLSFCNAEGQEYEGNLIDDIIEYRSLRSQRLRGGFAQASLRQRFESLRERLRQPPSTDPKISQRAFCRFDCQLQIRLRRSNGEEHACQLRDLGVDGARLILDGRPLHHDAVVWLTIDLLGGDRSRSVALAGRVIWTDHPFVGMAFAGASGLVKGCYTETPVPRKRDRFGAVTRPRGLRLAVQAVETDEC
ncbi:MAG: FHA domain-containing protein [Myxococcota bacterium]